MQRHEAVQYLIVNNIDPISDALIAYRDLLNAGFVITGSKDDRVNEWESLVDEYKRIRNDNSI